MSKDYEIHDGTLFNYTAGVLCGVLVPEKVAKKLARLQCQHIEAVRRLLSDHKDELFPKDWTLHYPDKKQTVVNFIDTREARDTVERRIKNATKMMGQLGLVHPVFIAEGMEAAEKMADAYVLVHADEQ